MRYSLRKQSYTSAGRDSSPRPSAVTGTSLLLVVFLVLCLVTFAALCLSTAQSDYSYSVRLTDRRHDYYAACNTANTIAAEIDSRLEAAADSGTEPDFSGLDVEYTGDSISYAVGINERQELRVELTTAANGSNYYEISSWQVVTTAAESGTQTLVLMDPEVG